jgi:signal transduction histidine kinase
MDVEVIGHLDSCVTPSRKSCRRQVENFSDLLGHLSARFARIQHLEIDSEIEAWMERIIRALKLDRCALGELDPDKGGFRITHQWGRKGLPKVPMVMAEEIIPWIMAKIRAGKIVATSNWRSLPPQAAQDKRFFERFGGPESFVVIPLIIAEKVVGGVAFGDFHGRHRWPSTLLNRLKLAADIFANALVRGRLAFEADQLREQAARIARTASMGEMAASIAHELNQPLAAILANAQAARRLLERHDPNWAEIREILDDIVSDERRATCYLKEVRNVFKKNGLHKETLDIGRLVDDVALLLRSDMMMRRVSLQVRVEPSLPRIEVDRVGIEQVMINLIRNAADAVSGQEPSSREVVVRASPGAPGWIRIAVSDAGRGIELASPERVFEPFFTTKADGLGMGLAIVRSIVEAHGGEIHARANSGPGTIFEFTVPAVHT